jgi:hypothetical protein
VPIGLCEVVVALGGLVADVGRQREGHDGVLLRAANLRSDADAAQKRDAVYGYAVRMDRLGMN